MAPFALNGRSAILRRPRNPKQASVVIRGLRPLPLEPCDGDNS